MPEKVAESVYKISCDGNVYIYLEPEVFLIDCSDNRYSEFIKKEIEKVVGLDEVKKIFLTHLHYDHCGNLDLFSKAEVFASKKEIDDFNKNSSFFFLENVSKETIEKLNNATEIPKKINGLEIIECSGHTRGSITLIDKKNKLLFSGDTLFKNGIGRTDFLNSVPEKMPESVERLEEFLKKGYKLCSGHDY